MTNQEIFDKTVNHLRSQGCKSKESNSNRCLYRGPNGTKCAVGCHIPDEIYHKCMEDKSAQHLIWDRRLLPDLFDHCYVLVALQCVHDQYSVNDWESQFEVVAREHDLVYSPPESAA